MKHQFEIAKLSRNVLLKMTDNLTAAQYNFIPKGFHNNIGWNLGHILVTQQLLVHKLSNVDCVVDKDILVKYGKDSTPQTDYTLSETEDLKSQLMNVIETTEKLYNKGDFKTFNVYPTSLGYTINNIQDAISFSNYHEGIHIGIILSLKKLV